MRTIFDEPDRSAPDLRMRAKEWQDIVRQRRNYKMPYTHFFIAGDSAKYSRFLFNTFHEVGIQSSDVVDARVQSKDSSLVQVLYRSLPDIASKTSENVLLVVRGFQNSMYISKTSRENSDLLNAGHNWTQDLDGEGMQDVLRQLGKHLVIISTIDKDSRHMDAYINATKTAAASELNHTSLLEIG